MKTKLSVLLSSFSCIGLLLIACNGSHEGTVPEQTLLDKLSVRFENNNYISSHNLLNPYDGIGKRVENFNKEILKEKRTSKTYATIGDKKFLQAAGILHFTSNDRKTWGVKDPDAFQNGLSKLKKIKERNGETLDTKRYTAINDELNSYYKDESGVSEILDDAFKKKAISHLQRKILISTMTEMSQATTRNEMASINSTVEYEVLNSDISEKDKALILSINSLVKYRLDLNFGGLSSNDWSAPSEVFRAVAAETIVAIVVGVVIGAVAGTVIGLIPCCVIQSPGDSCDWSCIAPYTEDGAIVGGILAAVLN